MPILDEALVWERLRKEVRKLRSCWRIFNLYRSCGCSFSYKMVMNFDVLRSCVHHWILHEFDARLIVTEDRCGAVRGYTQFLKHPPEV